MTADLAVGQVRQVTMPEITRTQIVQFAGASGDFNPLHTDEVYATQALGRPLVIAHGRLAMGFAGAFVTTWFGVDAIRKLGARFVRPVLPGDRLTIVGTVTGISGDGQANVDIRVTNQNSEEVLSGYCIAQP